MQTFAFGPSLFMFKVKELFMLSFAFRLALLVFKVKESSMQTFAFGPALLVALVTCFSTNGFAGSPECPQSSPPENALPWIGYTQLRTNLLGGRHANVKTMRAMMVRTNGNSSRELLPEQIENENTWTQFAGWSPDGKQAIIGLGWQDPANARWEEENKTFRMDEGKWRVDSLLFDPQKKSVVNVTGIDRVSNYNGGLFFLPGAKQLGFTPLIKAISRPFVMDLDGKNKKDVSGSGGGFAYGYSASPDGTRLSYHENYQIYISHANGSNKKVIETGNPFNFGPLWSPDGKYLLFLSGKHGASNPFVVGSDGTGLRKVVDLGGYKSSIAFLDVYDFHEGSSDLPIWSLDGQSIFHTALFGDRVELCQTTLAGKTTKLTESKAGVLHYHPQSSPDGKHLVFGSKRMGVRQVYVMDLATKKEQQITNLKIGEAAMWPHWQKGTPE